MTKTWKLKEIVLMSVLGVVFGLIYLLFFLVGQGIRNVLLPIGLAPFAYEIIFGIWFIVSIVAAYIIRKPGVAFTSEVIAAVVEVLVGSPAGPGLLIAGAIQGAGAELAFALTKWKDYRLRILVLSGVLAAAISFLWGMFSAGNIALEPGLLIATFFVRVISGAILAGVLGKWISDQLAKTGVLSGYALGKEYKQYREQSDAGKNTYV